MQQVSRAWIANQKRELRNESFVEVTVSVGDPSALDNASATDSGAEPFSNTPQIVDGLDKSFIDYITLERNQWLLDGSKPFLADGDTGYVGNVLSDENAEFDVMPIVSILFEELHDNLVPGITIKWSNIFNEYASEYLVRVYANSQLVTQKAFTNDSVESISEIEMTLYDRIDIEIVKWCLPFRRPRIEEVFVGIKHTYRKSDLLGYKHEMIADPLSASLPKYSVTYDVNNVDNAYDPNNLEGFARYLIERQVVDVRYGYKINDEVIEWIQGGSFYLSEWTSQQNGIIASFVARDMLEFTRGVFTKGLYRPQGISLYDLAVQVLTEADLPLNRDGSVNWYINDILRNVFTTAPLPALTIGSCLQLIANAGCCCLSFDRSGRLRIDPMSISTFMGHSVATDNGSTHFSNTGQIVDGQPKEYEKYSMFERNQWLLDGEYKVLPASDWGDTGFVGKTLSDENGVFPGTKPKVTLSFTHIHNALITYIAIVWSETYGEYAVDFRITAIGEDSLGRDRIVAQKLVEGNTDIRSVTDIDMREYKRIEIEVLKWCLPNRRARIEEIPSRPDYEINRFNSYARPEITMVTPLGGVSVKTYRYFPRTELMELYNGTVQLSGQQTITISHSSAVNVVATVTGGTLNRATYYTYSCDLTITANGTVTIVLTGNTLEISHSDTQLLTGQRGEIQPVDNALITSAEQARAVGEWAKDYLISRQTATYNWRSDPRADVLDAVMVQNNFGFRPSRLTELRYEFTGGFKATGSGRVIIE